MCENHLSACSYYNIIEELGRHEGNKESCVVMSVSVSHVLWECSAYYSNSRADFLLKLQEKLGNGFKRFDALDSLGKMSFYLRQRVVGRAF